MRILHVGKFYPPHKGGMETALRLMAEGLLDSGHEVRVLVAGHGCRTLREELGGHADALIRAGVAGHWNSQPLTLGLAGELKRQLRAFQPRIVHLHTPNPLACAAWLLAADTARDVGARLAVWHHSDIVRQRLAGRLVAPLVRRCLARAHGLCVSSEHLRQTSRELAPWRERVAVIPFGIDAAAFADLQPDGDGPFLFVGRLVPYKGLETMLTALHHEPRARLDIVGGGPLRDRLARRLRDENLAHRVRLLGEVTDAQLLRLLEASRALVLPSRDHSETFGLSLLEGMAAGLPLIASDLPTGVRDLARPDETGWLVPPGNAERLAGALTACLDDPARARRLGQGGRDLVHRRFTRARLAADLVDWYATLTADDA